MFPCLRLIGPALLLLAAPATAQVVGPPAPDARSAAAGGPAEVSREAPINGVLTLYGNQRCPTNSDGAEIVVCRRRGAEEQFRVPKELRELVVTSENEAWAAKAKGTLDAGVGVNGIGSCSAVGPGGASGCFARSVRENRRENAARVAAEPVIE